MLFRMRMTASRQNRTLRPSLSWTHSRTRGRVACSLGRLTSAAPRRSVCDRRQGELKASAAGQVRARPQSAAVRFDDRTADRQAHPQTAKLRRVEGLEHALKSRRREAWTRIAHLDRHAIWFVAGADEQFPLLFADVAHRFDRVDDQVKQDLLQLDPVSLDTRQALRKLRLHRHAIVCGLRTGESNNLENSIADRYVVLSCGHLLDERADSPDDLACTLPLPDNNRERVIHLAKIRWLRA